MDKNQTEIGINIIVEGLKNLSKKTGRLIKLISIYNKLEENQVDNAYTMGIKLAEISKLSEDLSEFKQKNELSNWINNEKKELEKAKDSFRFELGEKLKSFFAKEGKEIKGQYPKLRTGLYTIKLNFEFGEAELFFGPEVLKLKSKIPLNPEAIYQAIKNENEKIVPKKFEPQEFYDALYAAYKKKAVLTSKNPGEKLLIIDILNEYVMANQSEQFLTDPKKENFKEFPRTKLCYMLYLLKKSSLPSRNLRFYVANFDATTDKKHSIWIPDNDEGDGTYYSYLSFS